MANQTFEELVANQAKLSDEITGLKTKLATFVAQDDKDDETKSAFLKAQDEMDKEEKDASSKIATMDKVKDAFKKATDESDPEKKKEAMKKAVEMKEEMDKEHESSKKATDDKDEDDKPSPREAALEAEISAPYKQKILEAAKMFEPANLKSIEAKLRVASLTEVKEMWASKQPYVAAMGIGVQTTPESAGFIPFQASSALDTFEGEADYSKMDSEKLLSEMYQ